MREGLGGKGENWLIVNGNEFDTSSVKGFEVVVGEGEKVREDLEEMERMVQGE